MPIIVLTQTTSNLLKPKLPLRNTTSMKYSQLQQRTTAFAMMQPNMMVNYHMEVNQAETRRQIIAGSISILQSIMQHHVLIVALLFIPPSSDSLHTMLSWKSCPGQTLHTISHPKSFMVANKFSLLTRQSTFTVSLLGVISGVCDPHTEVI